MMGIVLRSYWRKSTREGIILVIIIGRLFIYGKKFIDKYFCINDDMMICYFLIKIKPKIVTEI